MYWSKTLIPTQKENPTDAESISYQLMLRAGLIRMLMSGVYSYLPLGWTVLNKIQTIIRQEMDSSGACEVLLPALQPLELWQKSGRDKDLGDVMIRFTNRKGRKICLGPTHEEVITDLVKNHVSSYRQLPLILYQIQTKFRDEIRPRFGLVRGCEFLMKDAYSFDQDQRGLEKNYELIYTAYQKIFKRCGLDFLTVEADPGVMGGSISHEFMVPAADGEDVLLSCKKCNFTQSYEEGKTGNCPKCKGKREKINALEVGHIFQLGTKYSHALGANFIDAQGKLSPVIMGCYGIGVSRLISAVIESNHDARGIIWPNELSPYDIIILPLDVTRAEIIKRAEIIYQELKGQGISVLLDDRDERAGVKFMDADLLGVTAQIIIGQESCAKDILELKIRRSLKKIIDKKEKIFKFLKTLFHG